MYILIRFEFISFKRFNLRVETLNPKYGRTTCSTSSLENYPHLCQELSYGATNSIRRICGGEESLSPSLSKSHVQTSRRITPLRTSAYKAEKECKCAF